MSDIAALPLADTSDMIGVHHVFREAMAVAPRLVASVAPGDTERAEVVATYYRNVLAMLHAHHEGEDQLMTPRLLERCPERADAITRVASQHHGLVDAVTAVQRQIPGWAEDPAIETGAKLAAALATVGAQLTIHTDDEEREILPIAARCMNVAEWGELPAHSMRSFSGDKLWLVLGLVQEQMTPEQVASMEANMPPQLADFWSGMGRQLFKEFVADLRR